MNFNDEKKETRTYTTITHSFFITLQNNLYREKIQQKSWGVKFEKIWEWKKLFSKNPCSQSENNPRKKIKLCCSSVMRKVM